MKIRIEMEVNDESADPGDSTGLTEQAFEAMMDYLMHFGYDIDIEARYDN